MERTSGGTRERILEAAAELFALRGYDGASIREIAALADANIAAVNYHFTSKQRLYWENFRRSVEYLDVSIDALASRSDEVVEFSVQLMGFLRVESAMVRNVFKMFISGQIPEPTPDYLEFSDQRVKGPPGCEALMGLLARELGRTAQDPDLLWAARTILHYCFHWTLIVESDYFSKMPDGEQAHPRTHMDADLKRTVVALLAQLR